VHNLTWHGRTPRPRPRCVRWGPSSPQKGHNHQFLAHVRCGQTAGWIKMPHGMEAGIGPGHIVSDGDPASPPRKGHRSPAVFGPCLLWSNVRPYRLLLSTCYIVQATLYKTCSAVVEPGDRLTTILMDRKVGDVPHFGGVGSASHAMWPGPKPTFVRSGILIHPAVWPQ